ncbi:hypothetical protein V5O48_014813 [Marasmius crinis-equi]|uniref:Uncharacterized protein n=1 Tax=Marasmius crinis-equi TaxID=585013 RepID=A0ABR3EWK1_9AGAR
MSSNSNNHAKSPSPGVSSPHPYYVHPDSPVTYTDLMHYGCLVRLHTHHNGVATDETFREVATHEAQVARQMSSNFDVTARGAGYWHNGEFVVVQSFESPVSSPSTSSNSSHPSPSSSSSSAASSPFVRK